MKLERPGYEKFIQTEKEQKLEDRKILLDAKKKKALLDAKLISKMVTGETYYCGKFKQNITITKTGSGRETQGSGTSYFDYFDYTREDGRYDKVRYQVKESEIIKKYELSKAKAVDQKHVEVRMELDRRRCAWLTTNSELSATSVEILKQIKIMYVGRTKEPSFKLCVTAYTEIIAAETHRKAFYNIKDRDGASMTQVTNSLKIATKALKDLGRYLPIKAKLATHFAKLIKLQNTNIDASYILWIESTRILDQALFEVFTPAAYRAKEDRKNK